MSGRWPQAIGAHLVDSTKSGLQVSGDRLGQLLGSLRSDRECSARHQCDHHPRSAAHDKGSRPGVSCAHTPVVAAYEWWNRHHLAGSDIGEGYEGSGERSESNTDASGVDIGDEPSLCEEGEGKAYSHDEPYRHDDPGGGRIHSVRVAVQNTVDGHGPSGDREEASEKHDRRLPKALDFVETYHAASWAPSDPPH